MCRLVPYLLELGAESVGITELASTGPAQLFQAYSILSFIILVSWVAQGGSIVCIDQAKPQKKA